MNLGPDSLPTNAAGSSSVDIIAVSQDALDSSRPLKEWVALGGIAIVPGIPVFQSPAAVPASAILRSPGPGLVPVIKLTGRPNGRTILAKGNLPLIFVQRVGLGRVIYLAFNPSDRALLGKSAYKNLWREILQSACSGRTIPPISDSEYSDPWLATLSRQGMDVGRPKVYLIAAFLGAYILLLVPINYFVLRRLRRKELAWITIPALVVVFALTAYIAGSVSREKKLVTRSVQIFEMTAGSGFARYTGNLSLFSPNRSRRTIEFSDSALVSDTGFGGSAGSFPILQSVRTRDKLVLPNADLFMWSVRTLEFEGIRPVPGMVTANLTINGTRIKGTITNNLTFALKDCILYGDRFEKEIGELKPGAAVYIDEPLILTKRIARRPPDQRKYSFLWRTKFSGTNPEQLVFSGRPEWSDAQITVEGTKMDQPFDMAFVYIYPRWVNGTDGKVTGSIAGVTTDCESSYPSMAGNKAKRARDVGLETTVTIRPDGSCYLQYRLPRSVGAVTGLSLYLGIEKPVSIHAQVYDNLSGKWVDIGNVSQSGKLAIPNPKRMIGLEGIVQVRLKRLHGPEPSIPVNARLAFQGKVQ